MGRPWGAPLSDPVMPDGSANGPREAERPVVLLVDDEEALRSLGRRILERHGFSVLEASTGDDALRIARAAKRIDLLVTDLSMPGMTGRELADRLTRDDERLGVLFLSGGGAHELEHASGQRAASTFLEKPFSPSSLVHKLRELLARSG